MKISPDLYKLGTQVDNYTDEENEKKLRLLLNDLAKITKNPLSSFELSYSYYCIANTWSALRHIKHKEKSNIWEWHQNELEKEIFFLRKSLYINNERDNTFNLLSKCYTNLANAFSHIGRYIESVEHYMHAISLNENFSMAHGNKGIALFSYAKTLYDEGHQAILLWEASNSLYQSLGNDQDAYSDAQQNFEEHLNLINNVADIQYIQNNINLFDHSLGETSEEIEYRKWSLHNCLFLNPLNDLGPYQIAAADVTHLPGITYKTGEYPLYTSFFNQLKQEYIAARFFYYEGITKKETSIADKNVLILDTLDQTHYSIGSENVKSSFRVAYSIFDKIAYFINHYYNLQTQHHKVNFKKIWHVDENPKRGLKPVFTEYQNWPLRGLFWLSKDLYDSEMHVCSESIDPEAESLATIRNHIEHRYFKLKDETVLTPSIYSEFFIDKLAYSMERYDFEKKALKLLKSVRCGLLYLSFAINIEESRRSKSINGDIFPIDQFVYSDDLKL